MIWIGNQTACWAATPAEPFDYALAQGFEAFEWFPDKKPGAGWDESDLDDHARQHIREAADARGMRLSVHARWQVNLLSPDSAPLLGKDLELARDLGAALLNVHLFHEQGLSAFVEAIIPLMRQTAEAGLQLAIENTPLHSPEQFNEFFVRLRALESVETSHVGMCLDLGHANLCSATRNDYLAFVDRLDPTVPIIHLHLHENWGDADTHLPLFTGPADRDDSGIRGLVHRLRQRNFSGSIILEQWPHPPSRLNNARDRLLQLWNSSPGEPKPRGGSESLVPERPVMPNAPSEDLVAELVAGNQRCRSWREKLEFVRSFLVRDDAALRPDQLIDIAIYLRFLGTGEIACSEDGRHFRPAHHARIAAQTQERLARLTTPDNAFIVRAIYPWLPSSSPAFQRPEPLTRIRDIAHRNDIGQDLKREIKTTLQNKLHRCAGPEDLATSSALLERITAPGANYSPAFVEQFKIFHEELKEFFNAQSLDERLAALAPLVDGRQGELIDLFRRHKAGKGSADQIATFQTLTTLRQGFLDTVERKPGLESQAFLLADIALEDVAFVLLSEIINACEDAKSETAWECQMEALILALRNLALSGFDRPEANAVEAELQAWGKISPSPDREELLRVKATLLRCRRLAEDFGARTVALFSGRAEKLGRALGIVDHAIRVFSESDLRAHNIFQVSKLATSLLRRIRQRLGLAGWDVLVVGHAVGQATTVDSLDQLERRSEGPVVALLKHAAGDEEIPKRVAGIVLAHGLPHLSHLAVRARQAGVVLAACEEVLEFERIQRFAGRMISFLALPDKVTWEDTSEPEPAASQPHPSLPRIPTVRLDPDSAWIPLADVVAETGGGKATGARQLAELSRLHAAGFSTPPGIVVPFGVMEAQLRAAPAVAAEYWQLVKRLDGMPSAESGAATQHLRELIERLVVPEAILSEVARTFAQNSLLVVRSSANCEDVEGLAGAGLYDSVINVAPADVASAIRIVWSSLWTRRATLSRQQVGLHHEQAHMAALIQEMVVPDFSFVLHTVNPINNRTDEVYAEIVVGLGETLASAAIRGSPYRLVCDKASGAATTLAFANFSQASQPNPGGGLRHETADYSRVDLSRDASARQKLGRRLAPIGRFVEEALQRPQDIEGVVVGDRIWLVQARPQPGLRKS
jgi:phosphoglucan, water dikinase